MPVWSLADRPDRLCTDWRDLYPTLTDKDVWKDTVMRAVTLDLQLRMDTHIGTSRHYSSRFMQQKRLLALETPESTDRRMKVISNVPFVLGARLSILDIADHNGRYEHNTHSVTSVCPRCLLSDTIETLDHVFWECSAHNAARESLYDTMYTLWPLFTSSVRDITQKTYFLLGCNMPINISPAINEDHALRLRVMKAANAFLFTSAIFPARASLRQHRN